MRLTIPKAIFEAMVEHCRNGLPNEACGFLGGRDGRVEEIYPLTNAAASPVFYRPADKEMIESMRSIEEQGIELAAIFHSHVASSPYPSPTDVTEAHYPDAVYVIVSLADLESPETKGFLIRKSDWRDERGEVEVIELVVSSD